MKGIAFLIPNASQSASLQSFVVSIDSVESVTGIDFFPGFPDEAHLEKTSCVEGWSWKSSETNLAGTIELFLRVNYELTAVIFAFEEQVDSSNRKNSIGINWQIGLKSPMADISTRL